MAFFKRLFGKKDSDVQADHKGDIVEVDSNEKDGAQESRLTYHPDALSTGDIDDEDIRRMYDVYITDELIIPDIALLYWYSIIKDSNIIPGYFEYRYGLDADDRREYLFDTGYIEKPDAYTLIPLLKNDELKDILRDRGLKVGGNKSALIERIKTELPLKELEDIPSGERYVLTQKGYKTLEEFDYIVFGHKYFGEPITPLTMYQEHKYLSEQTDTEVNTLDIALSVQEYYKAQQIEEYRRKRLSHLGRLRNSEMQLHRIFYDEKNMDEALVRLITVLIYDSCSGIYRRVTVNLYTELKRLTGEMGIDPEQIDGYIERAKSHVYEFDNIERVYGLIHATLSGNDDEFERIREEVDSFA